MNSKGLLCVLGLSISLQFGNSFASDRQIVLVIGAGQSGRPAVRILVEKGYEVRVMVRDPTRTSGLPSSAVLVTADATRPESLSTVFADVDYAISTLGSPCEPFEPFPVGSSPEDVDYLGVANLAEAAKNAGTKQLVLMSSLRAGSDDPEDPLNRMCGMVLAWKGKGEEYLRASGVPYTIVRPGGLRPVPGEPPCIEGKVALRMYPGAQTVESASICRADVAMVMVDALGNADAIGKTVNLISDTSAAVDGWRDLWGELPQDKVNHAAEK